MPNSRRELILYDSDLFTFKKPPYLFHQGPVRFSEDGERLTDVHFKQYKVVAKKHIGRYFMPVVLNTAMERYFR